MNKNFALGTVVGAVVLLVLGYVIYVLLFGGFFENNMGSATGVAKETPDWLWLILGQVAGAAILTLVLGWAGSTNPAAGARTGALFGFLVALWIDLTIYATANVANLTATLVDPILAAVMFGVTGAVIGMVIGREEPAAAPTPAM